MNFKRLRQRLSVIILLIGLLIFGNLSGATASDPQRVLRAEIRSLENRVRRLESEVSRLKGISSEIRSPQIDSNRNTQIIEGELIGRSDPLMERFGNLIIELKDQVNQLDQRVSQLENKD